MQGVLIATWLQFAQFVGPKDSLFSNSFFFVLGVFGNLGPEKLVAIEDEMGPERNHSENKFSELARLVGKRLVRHAGVLAAIQFIMLSIWIKKSKNEKISINSYIISSFAL